MATSDAPLEISHVTLRVRDLDRLADFYGAVLGLAERARDERTVVLGTGDKTLLVLKHAPGAAPHTEHDAGLFHTAFLLPRRADLGAFLDHVRTSDVALEGAADHAVSEAIYLSDPEGNGIEVYRDRPRSDWQVSGGSVFFNNSRLDAKGILAEADGPWKGAPAGTVIGHVHLRVGEIAPAEAFWHDTLGLALTARFDGASFLGSGGYHHHIGVNVWRSKGAGAVPAAGAGLARVHLSADAPTFARLAGATPAAAEDRISLSDPWDIPVEIARRAAVAAAA